MANGFWSNLFNKGNEAPVSSAQAAKDRLSVIVATDHKLSTRLHPEKIERMKREILDVVNKYIHGVHLEDVIINHRSEAEIDMLEMNINLPDSK